MEPIIDLLKEFLDVHGYFSLVEMMERAWQTAAIFKRLSMTYYKNELSGQILAIGVNALKYFPVARHQQKQVGTIRTTEYR